MGGWRDFTASVSEWAVVGHYFLTNVSKDKQKKGGEIFETISFLLVTKQNSQKRKPVSYKYYFICHGVY